MPKNVQDTVSQVKCPNLETANCQGGHGGRGAGRRRGAQPLAVPGSLSSVAGAGHQEARGLAGRGCRAEELTRAYQGWAEAGPGFRTEANRCPPGPQRRLWAEAARAPEKAWKSTRLPKDGASVLRVRDEDLFPPTAPGRRSAGPRPLRAAPRTMSGSHSVTQAGVEWYNHSSLQPQTPRLKYPPTSASRVAVTTVTDQAFVTLATDDIYCQGALVLGQSLRRHRLTRKLVVLITPQVSSLLRQGLARRPGLSAVIPSRLTATSPSLAQVIFPPQPSKQLEPQGHG
ncbi:uncharacterized protein LOC112208066 [Pan troglodytes]|uniref:uncharacterized protein LOC112208066 n=1 Tax=Pan troglodytes TaxID=9598 RepID=UPI0023EFDA15|nr:uncharacterized protein LOC112208066 [Pan troglodytes]